MKGFLKWFAGLAGVAALGRQLARRTRHPGTAPEPIEAGGADPAEELRRRLAGARQAEPAAEPESSGDAPAEESLEERRARVHAKAREAIDAMGDEAPR